jgi:predicted HD superfamily hydrolase involved in NAD metabolism
MTDSRSPALWPEVYDRIIDALHQRLKPKRLFHTLGVLETALSLAARHGVDPERVAWAALLHDFCKTGEAEGLRRLAADLGEVIPPEDLDYPGVWHAWAAAGLACHEWGLQDTEILDAIRHHPTGHPAMSAIAKILFLADFLEPTRGHPQHDELLAMAHRSLDEGLIAVLQAKVEHLAGEGKAVHPRAAEALAAFTQPPKEV